ncbi:MAG: hypothetical protein WB607_29980 [Candidatus Acidiferrum sp.]
MRRAAFASLVFACLFIVSGGDAQNLPNIDKPTWTMEFIKVKPGMFGLTLGYLDDNWMRVAEEAKRRGAVVTYHRFVEQSAPGSDRNIVLVTEFKNQTAYVLREKLFDSIRQRLPNNTSGVLRPQKQEDLYEIVNTATFVDFPDLDGAQNRLLSRNRQQGEPSPGWRMALTE